jgi:RNA polymerase sigma-70 factor (ECF subfamily)
MMKYGSRSETEAAFSEIYDRFSPKVYSYCMRVLGKKEVAEDIFQEVFIKFYQNVNPEHENLQVLRFLITIARNQCLNYKKRQRINLPIDEFEFLVDNSSSHEEGELLELIKLGLDLLDMDYKEPLILRVYNEMGYDEIAQILEISESNARIRVYRAKEKLKDILSPYIRDLQKNS